jgi:hypothetical protein
LFIADQLVRLLQPNNNVHHLAIPVHKDDLQRPISPKQEIKIKTEETFYYFYAVILLK